MLKIYLTLAASILTFTGVVFYNSSYQPSSLSYSVEDSVGPCSETVEIDITNPIVCPDDTDAVLTAAVTRSAGCPGTFMYFFSWRQDGTIVRNFLAPFNQLSDELNSGNSSNSQVPPGMYTVNVSDQFNGGPVFSDAITVEVTDNTDPVITCPPNINAIADPVSCDAVVTWSLPTVTDNCSFTLTQIEGPPSGSTFNLGPGVIIRYEAEDGNGNSATCSFSVTVNDETNPSFDASTLPADTQRVADGNGEYVVEDFLAGVQAEFDCSPNFGFSQSPGDGSVLTIGTYTVTLGIQDGVGNVGADYQFELEVVEELAVADNTLESLQIINPRDGMLQLINPQGLPLTRAVWWDAHGRQVNTIPLNTGPSQFLSTDGLASGLYFMGVELADGRQFIRRFVKH